MSIERGLTFLKFAWMPLLLVACSGNTSVGEEMMTDSATLAVALNQRVFPSESTTPSGSACNTYLLTRGGPDPTSGGGPVTGLPLGVSQMAVDYSVVVNVTDDDKLVSQKVYDETFFESGKRDDFTVTLSGQAVLLRFWGSFDPDGHPQCAPFSDDGSQAPLM